MKVFGFPDKPQYEFTKEQLAQRKVILKKPIEHINYNDLMQKYIFRFISMLKR